MARNDFHRASSAGHYTGTMNLPREESSAGQESVHAEIEGGYAPPIRTTFGLPADRAQLRDRGEHRPQVLKRAEAAGLSWPLPEGRDEARVETAVFQTLVF